ncbi:ribonuclease Z [Psychroflexus halocasei]|uniref:Ribonuclease Z n=2 Tax=Psychroflexus halocasei TaxID=908615 RepID=A0A1H3XNU1_9FLAO|nr:ribonuclease Z [Psychroflexus halocasei]
MMELCILGCHSATPKASLNPTSQVLEVNGEVFLIDCGEGTQVQLRRNRIRFSRIKHIFISHLHGDHCFGLIGLISTFGLLNRQPNLNIYGPKGIENFIKHQLALTKTHLSYQLIFHELESEEPKKILETEKVCVETIPLQHRIYTNGFLFKEKPGDRQLLLDVLQELSIDKAYYKSIVKGKDVELASGEVIKNEELTLPPKKTLSYAFCSDTAFKPDIVEQIQGVDVLYHEATFLEQHEDLAYKTMHSTARQAGIIAQKAKVGELILGHFSARYRDTEDFKKESETVFDSVKLASSGKKFTYHLA